MSSSRPDIGATWTRTLVLDLPRSLLVQYAGASGDFNPIHTDETYARDTMGLPSVMAHGMLTMGLTGTAIVEWAAEFAGVIAAFGGRFLQPVWPGDDIVIHLEVQEPDTSADPAGSLRVDVHTRNQDAADVFRGYAVVLPTA